MRSGKTSQRLVEAAARPLYDLARKLERLDCAEKTGRNRNLLKTNETLLQFRDSQLKPS
ncbi:MAG: hypothetical protein JNM76_15840 [Betaproteobacteria bacterium]|nr:hypothetical protein [Betaproteobacteria bacterium]